MLQSKLPLQWAWYSMAASALLVAQPVELSAQSALDFPSGNQPSVIQWWHGVIVLGGLSGLMLLDNLDTTAYAAPPQQCRGRLASGVRHIGQPEGYGDDHLGLLGAGLISGNHEMTRAGGRLVATLFVAGATIQPGQADLWPAQTESKSRCRCVHPVLRTGGNAVRPYHHGVRAGHGPL